MKLDLKKKIKVNKKEVVLDHKEAKELYDKLSEIYGKEKEYILNYPVLWNQPWYIDKWTEPVKWTNDQGTITVYNTSNTAEVVK